MRARLVVVGALAAVVSQVERGLDRPPWLRGFSGLWLAGPQSGYMSYIGLLLAC